MLESKHLYIKESQGRPKYSPAIKVSQNILWGRG